MTGLRRTLSDMLSITLEFGRRPEVTELAEYVTRTTTFDDAGRVVEGEGPGRFDSAQLCSEGEAIIDGLKVRLRGVSSPRWFGRAFFADGLGSPGIE